MQPTEDIERAVIGMAMREPSNLDEVLEFGVKSDDFQSDGNKAIWNEIMKAHSGGRPFDLVNLGIALRNSVSLLADIETNSPITQNVRYYAGQLVEAASLRAMAQSLSTLASKAANAKPADCGFIKHEIISSLENLSKQDRLVSTTFSASGIVRCMSYKYS